MLKIKKLLISVFLLNSLSIFSMEEVELEINEKTNLLDFKPKSLAVIQDKDLNKISLDEFIKKLPKEIWQEIISFLKYEDNKKTILQFLVQVFSIDDFTAKKIVIDLYRTVLLNSKGLNHFNNVTRNASNSWRNHDNKRLVKEHFQVLSEKFLNENKKLNFSESHFEISLKFEGKEKILILLHNKLQELIILDNFTSFRKHQVDIGCFEIKESDSAHFCGKELFIKSKFIGLIICNVLLFLVMVLSIYLWINSIKDTNLCGLGFGGCFMSVVFFVILNLGFWGTEDNSIKIRNKARFFDDMNKKIKDVIKNNNHLSLANSDEYFLKLLGHDNRVEDIADINYI